MTELSHSLGERLCRFRILDARAGGRVYPLLGNHEALVMLGDVRYTSPAEYEAFRTPDSEAVRERYYERRLTDRRNELKTSGQPVDEAAFRAEFLQRTPLGADKRKARAVHAGVTRRRRMSLDAPGQRTFRPRSPRRRPPSSP